MELNATFDYKAYSAPAKTSLTYIETTYQAGIPAFYRTPLPQDYLIFRTLSGAWQHFCYTRRIILQSR